MSLFDGFFKNSNSTPRSGAIPGGKQKGSGGHDHRTNTGDDRTPAQKDGDKKRKK